MLTSDLNGLRGLTWRAELRLNYGRLSYGNSFGSRYCISGRYFGYRGRFERAAHASWSLFGHLIISGIKIFLLKKEKMCFFNSLLEHSWIIILFRDLTPLASLFCKNAVCPPGPPALPRTAAGNLALSLAFSIFSSSRG